MSYDACIKRSVEYIENNLKNKIELEELSQRVFLSKYHFHRKFHHIVGEPVAEYIRKKRLMKAAEELINTHEKIVDIALRYQFSSSETFTKAFKKFYGLSPREFRKQSKISCQPSMAA